MEFLGRCVTDAEELQQGISAAVITGRQEDPGETKHGSSQNDPPREIQQYRCLSVFAVDPLEW